MYTQCPECQIAFRITADLLKQAGGRVRCGSCNTAFNAIEYLSETAPDTGSGAAPRPDADAGRELMEKLDELAGPDDVRIEDTGIEWRVLGDEDDSTDGSSADAAAEDTGSIRWFIEDTGDAPDVGIPEVVETDDATPGDSLDEQPALEFGPGEPEEPRYDDNTPLPEDFDRDDEAAPPSAAPQHRKSDRTPEPTEEFLEAQGDLELGEPEEWMELLGEFEEDQEDVRDRLADSDEACADADAAGESSGSLPIEVEEELAAIHTELSSRPLRSDDAGTPGDDGGVEDIVLDAGDDDEADEESEPGSDAAGLTLEEDAPEGANDNPAEADDVPGPARRRHAETTGEFEQRIADAELALAEPADAGEEPAGGDELQPDAHALEEELAADGEDRSRDDDDPTPSLPIDADLLRAMEDEDLAATYTADDGTPLVETIIMEGDRVQEAIHAAAAETQDDDAGAGGKDGLPGSGSLADTYMLNRRAAGGRRFRMPGKGVTAAAVLLLLLLGAQFVHYSRDWLATYGSFNQTVAPVYRMFGRPVTPEWDVTGWQFESTTGSETEELLTISSRIGNRAGQPLPYPLLHVSLTDRWEEIIGSRVLEPNEYLASDADPRRPVPPGERFTAVITIESPSADATGFKLNVCYRIDADRLRCAVEDFKP